VEKGKRIKESETPGGGREGNLRSGEEKSEKRGGAGTEGRAKTETCGEHESTHGGLQTDSTGTPPFFAFWSGRTSAESKRW